MAAHLGGNSRLGRWWWLVTIAARVAVGALLLLALPDFYNAAARYFTLYVPQGVRVWVRIACVALVAAVVYRRPRRLLFVRVPERRWEQCDALSAAVLERCLAGAFAAMAVLLLAGWVPHYLTWPLWTDSDQFAQAARAWDAGILPYRDQLDFDFPGPIYVWWVLGKLFGWGHTAPYYAFDAGLLLLFAAALVAWSRRLFGTALPGLVGFLFAVLYYTSLNYALVTQRDWQGPLVVVVGLLAVQLWPAQAGRWVSAAAMALGLAYRPQVVLFLPALLAGVAAAGCPPGQPRAHAIHALMEWLLKLVFCLVLAFTPLIYAGVFDDFVRVLHVTGYGGSYNEATPQSFLHWLYLEVSAWRVLWLLGGLAVLVGWFPEWRRVALVWGLALWGALLYKPISPIAHSYLDHPLMLVSSVSAALVLGAILRAKALSPALRLLAVAVIVAGNLPPTLPYFFRPWQSARMVAAAVQNGPPRTVPPGCERVLPSNARRYPACYYWEDYDELLWYLRANTTEHTRVADFIRAYPYPTINGSIGRLSPFPAAGGILWLSWVAPQDLPRFVHGLEQATDSVVVWAPDQPAGVEVGLEPIERVIRRFYRPEARFGFFQVWRRVPADSPADEPTAATASQAPASSSAESAADAAGG